MRENSFYHLFRNTLIRNEFFVQRIESGEVAPGCPDLFIAHKDVYTFIELKSITSNFDNERDNKMIPWRPAQKAWAMNYYIKMSKRKWSHTVAKLQDCYIVIPMIDAFEDDVLYKEKHLFYKYETLPSLCAHFKYRKHLSSF